MRAAFAASREPVSATIRSVKGEIGLQRLGRIAFGIDRNENRRDLASLVAKLIQGGAHYAYIARTNVRTMGKAEIDEHQLAFKILVADRLAILVHKRKVSGKLFGKLNDLIGWNRRARLSAASGKGGNKDER